MSKATVTMSEMVAHEATQRVAALLADRIADRVVRALMNAGFDDYFSKAMLKAIEEEFTKSTGAEGK